jgi:glycosyltransferase involved in cell wall biosynthesis
MSGSPQIVVVTTAPSPYQAELLNAVAADGRYALRAVYMERRHAERLWCAPVLSHDHLYWGECGQTTEAATEWTRRADLVVFAWYASRGARILMRGRARAGRPWVFWGERPDYHGYRILGKLRRRLQLAPLHRQRVPIWGIGTWAVESWRREFGGRRTYEVVPYFSDLTRFARMDGRLRPNGTRRLLFTGSLIHRKGVDLLARAFATTASRKPQLRLEFVGAGPMEPVLRDALRGFGGQVRFLGFQQWNQLAERYADADVLVTPSRHDGWGMVIPEGLAAGLPVLSTNRMGAAIDLISPGKNGWRIPAGSAEALGDVLDEIADMSDARLEELSAGARASVAHHQLADGVSRFCDAANAALRRGAPNRL